MTWTPACRAGSPPHDLRARFLPTVEKLTAQADGDVVLVSHGAAIRLAAAAMLGETAETQYVPNTGLVVLVPEPSAPAAGCWSPGTTPRRCTAT